MDLANQKIGEVLMRLDAARFAAKSRLRPILMTAISSLTGFMPSGVGQWCRCPEPVVVGFVVFGGLLVATVLSCLWCRSFMW